MMKARLVPSLVYGFFGLCLTGCPVSFLGDSSADSTYDPGLANASGAIDTSTASTTPVADTVAAYDASGDLNAKAFNGPLNGNATTATTAQSFSGSLAGDVTGTQAATVVSKVGGASAASVAAGAAAANGAVTDGTVTPGALLKTDNTGLVTAKFKGDGSQLTALPGAQVTGIVASAVTAANVSGIVAIANGGTGANTAVGALTNLAGGAPNAAKGLVQLDSSGKLPILDGSQLTNLPAGAGNGFTQLNGDVTTPSASGNVTATVAKVGGVLAANVASGANLANGATSANGGDNAGTLVRRNSDGSAKVTLTSDSVLSGSGTTRTTANVVDAIAGMGSDLTSGGPKLLQADASGNFKAGTITASLSGNATTATSSTSAANLTGANLAGDVTNSGNTITVAKIQGTAVSSTAPNATGQVLRYNSGTSKWEAANVLAGEIASGGTFAAINGSALTNLTGANVTGTVASATSATSLTGSVTATATVDKNATVDGTSANTTEKVLVDAILGAGSDLTSGGPKLLQGTAAGDFTAHNITANQVNGTLNGNATNVTGIVAIANGGTGGASKSEALTNLGAAASGANTDITSLNAGNVVLGTNPSSTLQVKGAFATAITTVTNADSPVSLNGSHSLVVADAKNGNIAVNLPAGSATTAGRTYTIKKSDSSTNTVTVNVNGGDSIEGSASYTLSVQWQFVTLVSNGAATWIIQGASRNIGSATAFTPGAVHTAAADGIVSASAGDTFSSCNVFGYVDGGFAALTYSPAGGTYGTISFAVPKGHTFEVTTTCTGTQVYNFWPIQ